jgi:hypothetical protein
MHVKAGKIYIISVIYHWYFQAAEYGSGAPKINLCYNNCALATPFRPIFLTPTTRPRQSFFPFIRNDYIL